jgi:IS30 family transposase
MHGALIETETANPLLRPYFPKGSSSAELTQTELDENISDIKNLLRKILDLRHQTESFGNNPHHQGRQCCIPN